MRIVKLLAPIALLSIPLIGILLYVVVLAEGTFKTK
jgi:hypothetical protein